MPLTMQEKEFIKNPRYYGNRYTLAPQVRRMAMPWEMNITKVPNTIITCTGCNGNRFVLQEHTDRFGSMTKEKCPICNGKGVMSNRVEAGY